MVNRESPAPPKAEQKGSNGDKLILSSKIKRLSPVAVANATTDNCPRFGCPSRRASVKNHECSLLVKCEYYGEGWQEKAIAELNEKYRKLQQGVL